MSQILIETALICVAAILDHKILECHCDCWTRMLSLTNILLLMNNNSVECQTPLGHRTRTCLEHTEEYSDGILNFEFCSNEVEWTQDVSTSNQSRTLVRNTNQADLPARKAAHRWNEFKAKFESHLFSVRLESHCDFFFKQRTRTQRSVHTRRPGTWPLFWADISFQDIFLQTLNLRHILGQAVSQVFKLCIWEQHGQILPFSGGGVSVMRPDFCPDIKSAKWNCPLFLLLWAPKEFIYRFFRRRNRPTPANGRHVNRSRMSSRPC